MRTAVVLWLCAACGLDDFRLVEAGVDTDAATASGADGFSDAGVGSMQPSCAPGSFRCDPTALEQLQVCDPLSSVGWVTTATCERADACDAEAGRCRVCMPGEHRCNSWRLEECGQDGTGWVLLEECPSPEQCDSRALQCSTCVAGEAYCSGSTLLSCNSNRDGYVATECESADECNVASMSCRPCFPGEVQCNQQSLVRCADDLSWQLVEDCGTPAQCEASMDRHLDDPSTPVECVEPACEPGTFSCSQHDGRTLLGCPPDGSGFRALAVCATPEACDATNGVCITPVCTPGSYQCSGTALQLCSADGSQWETLENCPSAELCNTAMRSCAPCVPGDMQCSANALQRCTDASAWETVSLCASTPLCRANAGGGTCVEPSCGEGEYRCLGHELELCNPTLDGFTAVMSCESEQACNAIDGRCDVLACDTPGSHRCRGEFLERCADDRSAWELVTTCETGSVCDLDTLGCADQCPAEPFRCNGIVPEQCVMNDDGTIAWQASAAPCATEALCTVADSGASCTAPACGGTLALYRCDPAQPLVVQRCNAARSGWETDRTCATGTTCDPGPSQRGPAQCDLCAASAYRCDDELLTRCELDGQRYTTLETCRDGAHCVASGTTGHCLRCDPGETQCNGDQLTACSSDRRSWVNAEACPAAFGCHTTTNRQDYCNVCAAPNEARCDGGTLDTCDAAQREIATELACEFGCETVSGANDYCRECSPNTAQCSTTASDERLVCNMVGLWDEQQCTGGSDCFDSGTADYCGSCDPGTFSCFSATQRQECAANGTPGALTTCATATPVCLSATGACVECAPGMTAVCTGAPGSATRETCSNAGAWQAANCSGGTAVCHDGVCRACYPGDTRCRPGMDPRGRDSCTSAGAWQAANCNAQSVCWQDECVECNPDTAAPRCTSSGGPGREVCTAGEWGAANCGTGQVCVDGACLACDPATQGPECLAGEGDSARRICNPLGTWERDDCEAPTDLCQGAGQCVCEEGATRCGTSGVRQECVGGAWVDDPCSNSYCDDGECVQCLTNANCTNADFPLCVDGACQCEVADERCTAGGAHQVCTGSAWNTVACMNPTPVCDSATGSCVCQEGAERCVMGTAEECEDGVWQTRAADPTCVACTTNTNCSGTTPICNGVECVACNDNCPMGSVCAASGACVECTTSDVSECTPPETMCSASNTCVECLSNGNCAGTEPICDQGSCRGCTGAAECPMGCRSDGSCGECTSNANCSGTTPICDDADCRACQTGECPMGCRSNGSCGECTSNANCSGTTPICDDADCRACQIGECGTDVCNTTTGACEACTAADGGVCP